jgi:hypothetical protein
MKSLLCVIRRTLPGYLQEMKAWEKGGTETLEDFRRLSDLTDSVFDEHYSDTHINNPWRPNDAAVMPQLLSWRVATDSLQHHNVFFPKLENATWALWQHYCFQATELSVPEQALDLLQCSR